MGYWDRQEVKGAVAEPDEREEDGGLRGFEEACAEELGSLEKGFRERMSAENKRFRDMCDTEYWFAVCCTSRAQKEELMRLLGLDTEEKYVSGRDIAKAIKKELKTPDLAFSGVRPFDKDYIKRAMN